MFGLALVVLFVLIAAFFRGGEAARLLDLHAFVMVVGGTLAAGAFAYPMAVFLRMPQLFVMAVAAEGPHLPTVVAQLVKASDRVRQQGRAAAPGGPRDVEDPFLKQGLLFVAEGFDPNDIMKLMEAELSAIRARHRQGIGMWEGLGGFAPTFGILGTVEAMVAILGNLTNPDKIGLDIAVAMVATLYGVGVANLIFLPVATRLKKLSEEELRVRQVMIDVLVNIQEGSKPEYIRERLRVALPPETRRTIAALSERRARRTKSQTQPVMQAPAGFDEYGDEAYGSVPQDQEMY